jgi:integrase
MAYIREHTTKARDNGKPVKHYVVAWRETECDEFGLPIPKQSNRPDGPKRTRAQQETYSNRDEAEARRDKLNAARHTTGTTNLAQQRKAVDLPFGHYARAWLDSQRLKVAGGKLKADTLAEYERLLVSHALPEFRATAIAAITPAHCERFLTTLVGRGLTPATVKHHWSTLRRVFVYALRHDAIKANPADHVDFSAGHATGDRERFEHHPMTADQVAAVASSVGTRYPVYELLTYFAAYTGLRAAELAGCEVGDLTFAPGPAGVRAHVNVRRTKARRGGQWVVGTLKSKRSRRTVPLPSWLAVRMRDYLDTTHPRADEPTALLWPNRALGGSRRRRRLAVAPMDYSEPVDPTAFYKYVLRPPLAAVGLPASQPARTRDDDTVVPAVKGVRFHDLRHTFATLQLSAGVHFMQVSKWLGHSTFTFTLDTYGDWIPEAEGGVANALPEPTAPAQPVQAKVLPLRRRRSS